MSVQEGDVVRFEYTLWADDASKPMETSQEAVAKEHGIEREDKQYRPLTITVGRQQVLPALEKHIMENAEEGKALEVTLAPEDAYGARDAGKINDIPMAQFRKQKIQPQVGLELNLQGQRGVITRVAGGRVRVDMNHELAGKTLRYQYTLLEAISDDKKKVQAIVDGLFPSGAKVSVKKDAVELEVPDQAKFDQQWPMHKFRVVSELRAAAGEGRAVVLKETYPAMPKDEEE